MRSSPTLRCSPRNLRASQQRQRTVRKPAATRQFAGNSCGSELEPDRGLASDLTCPPRSNLSLVYNPAFPSSDLKNGAVVSATSFVSMGPEVGDWRVAGPKWGITASVRRPIDSQLHARRGQSADPAMAKRVQTTTCGLAARSATGRRHQKRSSSPSGPLVNHYPLCANSQQNGWYKHWGRSPGSPVQ
jgi:hypothetical protein